MTNAHEALQRLKAGNLRFVQQAFRNLDIDVGKVLSETSGGQSPFAVILGCSDSRVPVEILFDQSVGDLFVIRVAGNIAAPSQIGSAEYAAAVLGSRLVVVLGHTGCGAVAATLEEIKSPSGNRSPNLDDILDRIRPSVEPLLETDLTKDPVALTREAIRANVRQSVTRLCNDSRILEGLIENEGLVVMGAEYSLENGAVSFFDDDVLN